MSNQTVPSDSAGNTESDVRDTARRHMQTLRTLHAQINASLEMVKGLDEEIYDTAILAGELYRKNPLRQLENLYGLIEPGAFEETLSNLSTDIESSITLIGKYLLPDEHTMDGSELMELIVNMRDEGSDLLRIDTSGNASISLDGDAEYSAMGVIEPETFKKLLLAQPIMRTSYVKEGEFYINSPQDAVMTLEAVQAQMGSLPPNFVFVMHDTGFDDTLVFGIVHEDDVVLSDDEDDIEEAPDLPRGYFPLGSIRLDDADLLSSESRSEAHLRNVHPVTLYNWTPKEQHHV